MVRLRMWDNGDRYWYFNNQRHRANGPAIINMDGSCYWFWHDQLATEYEIMMLVAQEKSND